jgi:hypothetical protein
MIIKNRYFLLLLALALFIMVPVSLVVYFKGLGFGFGNVINKDLTGSPVSTSTPVSPEMEKNGKDLESFVKQSSIDQQQQYISQTRDLLEDSALSAQEKAELNFKLATVQSVVRASPDMEKNRLESLNYFNSIITSSSTNKTVVRLKDYAILNSVHSLFQCCITPQEFTGNTFYGHSYNKYLTQYKNSSLSQRLALHDMMSLVSEDSRRDPSIRGISILITATLIDYFRKDLSSDYVDILTKDLGTLLSTNVNKDNMLMSDLANTVYEPALYEAYGYDVLNRVQGGKSSVEVNSQIDYKYKNVDSDLDLYFKQQKDESTYSLMAMYNLSRYIRSMDIRGYSQDNREMVWAVDKFMNILESSKEAKDIFTKVVANKQSQTQMYYMLEIAKKNPKLDQYIKSLHID